MCVYQFRHPGTSAKTAKLRYASTSHFSLPQRNHSVEVEHECHQSLASITEVIPANSTPIADTNDEVQKTKFTLTSTRRIAILQVLRRRWQRRVWAFHRPALRSAFHGEPAVRVGLEHGDLVRRSTSRSAG